MPTLHETIERVAAGGTREDCRGLAAHGADVIPLLAPYLESGWDAVCPPATVLLMIRGPGVVAALAELARGKPMDPRAAAIVALGHGRDPAALPVLTGLLGERKNQRRAAEALGRLGDDAAIAPLTGLLDGVLGSDPQGALTGFIAGESNLEVIKAINAGRALARLGDLRFAALAAWLSGTGKSAPAIKDQAVRLAAVEALNDLPGEEATRALLASQRDRDAEVAAAAIRALGGLGLIGCVPVWMEMLEKSRRHDKAIERGLVELIGNAPEDLTATAEVRRWWMRVSAKLPSDRCVWRGELATPARAIEELAARDGGDARWVLDRWTGIDFVDDLQASVAGDAHDVDRARAWWKDHAATWEAGALVRAGQRHPIAPIAAALAASGDP